jgi:hypothetical protein
LGQAGVAATNRGSLLLLVLVLRVRLPGPGAQCGDVIVAVVVALVIRG